MALIKKTEVLAEEQLSKILLEILNNEDLYSEKRGQNIDYHKYTKNILIRVPKNAFSELSTEQVANIYSNELRTFPTVNSDKFQILLKFLNNFAQNRNSFLGRVQIVSLQGGKDVSAHVDYGLYYAFHKRYHLVIKSKGSSLSVMNKTQIFSEGDVFYFENRLPHSAENLGNSERVHVIFDLLSQSFIQNSIRYLSWVFFYKWFYLHRKYCYFTYSEISYESKNNFALSLNLLKNNLLHIMNKIK